MTYRLQRLKAIESKISDLIVIAHSGQRYGDKPYTYHLRSVADKARELFGTPEKRQPSEADIKLSIVSLGHDLLEDTYVTKEALIEAGYDEKLVESIDLVTKKEGIPYNDYLRDLSKDQLAWKVKVADTFSNLTESIKTDDTTRVRKYSSQLELLYKYKSF